MLCETSEIITVLISRLYIIMSGMSRDIIVDKGGNLYSFLICFFLLLLSFEFVKSSGTSVVAINLPEQHKMNGKVLKHIAGNGPVYV